MNRFISLLVMHGTGLKIFKEEHNLVSQSVTMLLVEDTGSLKKSGG